MLAINVLVSGDHFRAPHYERHVAVLSSFDGMPRDQKALLRFNKTLPLISSRLIQADPIHAQTRLRNQQECRHAIVLIERGGGCSFSDKAKRAMDQGACAVIIANNDEVHSHSVFSMNGSACHSTRGIIPICMISYASYQTMLHLFERYNNKDGDGSIAAGDGGIHFQLDALTADDVSSWVPKAYWGTCMRVTALENDHELFQKLLHLEVQRKGKGSIDACYNEPDWDRGATAVSIAVEFDSIECLGHLLQCSPVIDAPRNDAYRPLHLAVEKDAEVCVSMLLSAGSYIDVPHSVGWTALHFCAQKGSISCLRLLLRAQASVDYQACDGSTPLLIAVLYGQDGVVEELLRAGADPFIANNVGNFPLNPANEQRSASCLTSIRQYTSRQESAAEIKDGRVAFWLSPSLSSPSTPYITNVRPSSITMMIEEEEIEGGSNLRSKPMKAFGSRALLEQLKANGGLMEEEEEEEGRNHEIGTHPSLIEDTFFLESPESPSDLVDAVAHAAQTSWCSDLPEDMSHRKNVCMIELPASLRPHLWASVLIASSSNPMVIPKTVNKAVFSKSRIKSLYEDLQRTKFNEYAGGEGLARLQSLILAWLDLRPEHVYRQGLTSLACPFLEVFGEEKEEQSLLCMDQMLQLLMQNIFLEGNSMDRVQEKVRHLETLMTYWDPDLAIHFSALGIHAELFSIPWLVTVFADVMPMENVIELWDVLISLGPSFFYCFCIAVIINLRDLLLQMDSQTCILITFSKVNAEAIKIDLQACLDRALLFYSKTPSCLLKPPLQDGGGSELFHNSGDHQPQDGEQLDSAQDDEEEKQKEEEVTIPQPLDRPTYLSFVDLAELRHAQEAVIVFDVRCSKEVEKDACVVPLDVQIISLPLPTIRGHVDYCKKLDLCLQPQMRPPSTVRPFVGSHHLSILAETREKAKDVLRMLVLSHVPFVSLYQRMPFA